MENNILNKLSVHITNTENAPDPSKLLKLLARSLITTDYVYSYLIYAQYDEDKLTGWLVEFLVSQTVDYNTISISDAILEVTNIIIKTRNESQVKYVIGYKQPPIEVLVETFNPLVKKLAAKQHRYWKTMEYEDLCQICRMVIVHLYNAGYYVHSKLISRAFINEVLMQLRSQRYAPNIISLDKSIEIGDGEEVTLMDRIVDKDVIERIEDAELEELRARIMSKKKDIIVEALGGSQRQYDQLVREYGNKQASPWARMTVQRIKKYLTKIEIDEKSFSHIR